jgi:hypothetical protein
MPIIAAHYQLNLSELPVRSEKLRARFGQQVVNGKNKRIFLYPDTDPGFEPRYVRYGSGIILKLSDGTVAQQIGQIVVTGQRIIGIVSRGAVGKIPLNSETGSIYGFSVDLNDIQPLAIRTNWRNKPIEVNIRSRVGQEPAFALQLFSVAAQLANDGKAQPASLPALLTRLSPEGRDKLLKA